jgi:glycosyltransferase involved in cell wall biosynthesis
MKNKIIILQRVCPSYRLETFVNFQKKCTNSLIIIGDNIPNSKVKNTPNLSGLEHIKLRTKHLSFFGRIFTIHHNLLSTLIKNKPEIIICEAESHLIGYLTALLYKFIFNKKVKLGYWCFIGIPGREYKKYSFTELFKKNIRNYFDHYFLYHNFGKKLLVSSGIDPKKISLITNVGNTKKFIELSKLKIPKIEAKKKLGLINNITLLFIGALDENKKPTKLFEIKDSLGINVNLIFLGKGPMLSKIIYLKNGNSNVLAPGHVNSNIELYLSASDIVIVPGRGGINISESLAFGLPVIVHQADGIEYDLITNGENGFILPNDNTETYCKAIKNIISDDFNFTNTNHFNSETMAQSLIEGCDKML